MLACCSSATLRQFHLSLPYTQVVESSNLSPSTVSHLPNSKTTRGLVFENRTRSYSKTQTVSERASAYNRSPSKDALPTVCMLYIGYLVISIIYQKLHLGRWFIFLK